MGITLYLANDKMAVMFQVGQPKNLPQYFCHAYGSQRSTSILVGTLSEKIVANSVGLSLVTPLLVSDSNYFRTVNHVLRLTASHCKI